MIALSAKNFGAGVARLFHPKSRARWTDSWQSNLAAVEERTEVERRAAPRLPISQAVTVRFSADGHYEFTGVSRNISESGMFLYADSQIKEGTQVDITLTLPSKTAQPVSLQVKGKVVRVESSAPAGIAIAFNRLVIAPESI